MFSAPAVEPPAAEAPGSPGPIVSANQPLSPAMLTSPAWRSKPSGEDLARVYPFVAQQRNQEGKAIMNCKVTTEGGLTDCTIISETPSGLGFGDATLRLAKYFKLSPTTADGKPVGGGTVRIPIMFRLPSGMNFKRPNFDGAFACYGQTANLAEDDPGTKNAWRATAFWSLQLQNVIAGGFGRPSDAEALERQARLAAQAGTLTVPKGFELKDCMAAIPK
jgi:TonB family protein